ncbi:MAG: hypothetical protein GY950_13835, partial [bacterium]|nr:hypothetical protein [bacterium]
DDRGFYSLIYPTGAAGKDKVPEDRELFLTVTDKRDHILHRESEPVQIKTGQVVPRFMVIREK